MKNKEHYDILDMAYELCEDKSTEYMMAFMVDCLLEQSSTPIAECAAFDKMIEYLKEEK
jgi:hypothetical protein